jgi:hypothetical protein
VIPPAPDLGPPQVIPPAPDLGPLHLGPTEPMPPERLIPLAQPVSAPIPLAQPVGPPAARTPDPEFARLDGEDSTAVIRRRPYAAVGLEALWLGVVSVVLGGFLVFVSTRMAGIYFADIWVIYVLHLVVLACGTAGIIIGLRDYYQARRRRVVQGTGLMLLGVLLNLIVVAWFVTTFAIVMIRDLAR